MAQDVTSLKLSIDSREVKTGAKDLDNLSNSANRAEKSADKTSSSFRGLGTSISTVAALALANQFITIADSITNVNNQLKLVTNSTTELKTAQEELFKIAQKTRQSYSETAGVYSNFALSMGEMGKSQKDILRTVETVNKAIAISGGTAQQAAAANMQLGQAFASGTLRGDELNSILENSKGLARAIADGMGVPIGKLRELGSEGKITAEVLASALAKSADDVDQKFSTMTATVDQAKTNVTNSIDSIVGAFDNATGATEGLSSNIIDFAKTLDDNKDNIVDFGEDVIAVGTLVADGLSNIYLMAQSGYAQFYLEFQEEINRILKEVMSTANETGAFWADVFNQDFTPFGQIEIDAAATLKLIEDNNSKIIANAKSTEAALLELASSSVTYQSVGGKDDNNASKPDITKAKEISKEKIKLEQQYQQKILLLSQEGQENKFEGLDKEALHTFNYYDNLIAKYSEVAGAEATLRALQSQAMDEIAAKIQEHNDLIDNTASIDALDEINDRYQTILDSQIAIAENGMNIDFNFEGTAADLDDIAKALQKMHVGSLKSTKADIDLQHKYAKEFLAAGDDIVKQKEVEANFDEDQAKLNEERKTAEIAGYATLAGAVSGAFAEGSAAAEAFQVVQAGLGLVNGVVAVLNAWALPYPANIPAVIATTAAVVPLMAQLGGALSAGGGGQSPINNQLGSPSISSRQATEDSSSVIVDRLDRQIDLLETISLQGTAGQIKLEKAQESFLKDFKLSVEDLVDTIPINIMATSDDMVGALSKFTDLVYTSTPWGTRVDINRESLKTGFDAIEFLNIIQSLADDAGYITGFVSSELGSGTTTVNVNEIIGQIQQAMTDYALTMTDVVDEMSSAADSFRDIFDNITDTTKYADIELQKSQADVNALIGATSYADYLEQQISAISRLEDTFDTSIRDLLLSTDPSDLQAQQEALYNLQDAAGIVFGGGVEDALNFLDSIELVGEALATSNDNIKSYNDSFKTEQQLAEDLAKTMGVTLAETVEDLDKLFLKLSTDWDGLTDSELQLLEANKSLLESVGAIPEVIETAVKDIAKSVADAYLGNLSYLSLTEKANYASGYLAMSAQPDSAISAVDAAKMSAEIALKTSATREQYIPAFERYVAELEKTAPDATNRDLLTELRALKEEVIGLRGDTVNAQIYP